MTETNRKLTKRERGEQGTIDLQEKEKTRDYGHKGKNAEQRKMKCMQRNLDQQRDGETGVEHNIL